MSEKSLYSVFQGGLQDAKNKGKTLVGYIVDDYNGTLSALQYVKTVVKDKIVKGETQNMVAQTYTTLASLGISGAMDDNGFIVTDSGISYQAACNLKGYMSFPVNYKSAGATQQNVSYVSVPATDSHVKSGVPLEKSGTAFPPTVGSPSENISWNIQSNDNCIIGVGLSVADFAPKFFNNFFPFTDTRSWKQKVIRDLASRGQLYAQVLVPKSETSAYVLHSRVIVDYGQSGESITTGLGEQTAKYDVFLPCPILLLDDFKALCSITVDASNNTEEKVGDGNVTYPLASAKYNHSTASIKGLTPQYLKAYTKKSGEVSFKNVNLCNTDKKALARVRLYFDKEAKDALTKNFNGSLPTEWAIDELFKGEADPNSYTATTYITSGGGVAVIGASEMQFYQFLSGRLADRLDVTLIKRAFDGVAQFESGQDWTKAADIGDGQGNSCGGLQFTEKAGGVKKYCKIYLQQAASNGVQLSESFKNTLNHGTQTGLVNNLSTFRQILDGDLGKLCQLKLWWQEKGQITVNCYNYVCDGKKGSALLLSSVMGSVNHLPNKYMGFLSNSGAKSINDMAQKIMITESAHWAMWMDFCADSSNYKYKGYTENGSWVKHPSAQTVLSSRGQIIRKVDKYAPSAINRFLAVVAGAKRGDFDMNSIPKRGQKPSDW